MNKNAKKVEPEEIEIFQANEFELPKAAPPRMPSPVQVSHNLEFRCKESALNTHDFFMRHAKVSSQFYLTNV